MTPGQFFRWGLKNVALVRDIGEAAEKVSLAKTNVERWDIIKPVGDKIAPAVDELTGGVVAFSEDETSKLRAELLTALKADAKQVGTAEAAKLGDGKWLERIEKALKLIELLMPLLGRFA